MGIVIKDDIIMNQKVDSYSNISHTGTFNRKTGSMILVVDKFMTEDYRRTENSVPVESVQENIVLKGKDFDTVMGILYKHLHKAEKFKKGVKK